MELRSSLGNAKTQINDLIIGELLTYSNSLYTLINSSPN